MYFKRFVSVNLFFLLLVLTISSIKVFNQNKEQAEIPKIEFEKYTLPNGLEVVLHVDRKLPIVHVNQRFRVGAANEAKGRTGMAHLFEHLMLQGSKNADKDYLTYVESIGANIRQGGANAFTRLDYTSYFATVPSGNLENLLWVESDRLATFAESLTREKLQNQLDVVRNERRRNIDNQPYGLLEKLTNENLYPVGHPYSHEIYGSHDDLTSATLEDMKEFFRTFYVPNNLSMVIAGDFDKAEAKRLVEKYFGTIPPGKPLSHLAKSVPKLDGEKIVEAKADISEERVYMAWHAPAFFDKDESEIAIASTILFGDSDSRIQKALVTDKLTDWVGTSQVGYGLSGVFKVFSNARKGVDLSKIEEAVTAEIARLAKEGPTDEELDQAKLRFEYRFLSGLESLGAFGGKADQLNAYNMYLGDPGKLEEDLNRYRSVTKESVRKAVDKYLNTKNRLIIRYRPEKGEKALQAAVDRTKEPPLGKDKPFKVPEIKTAKLANGLEIFVVERPEIPIVHVSLATKAGSYADPVGKKGLSKFTLGLMPDGTTTRSKKEITDQSKNLSAFIGTAYGKQYVSIDMSVLRKNVNPAFDLMADIVLNPAFPGKEFEDEKERLVNTLESRKDNVNLTANDLAYQIAFGEDHPFSTNSYGLLPDVKKLTRQDTEEFHKTYWKPGSSSLTFVGDISLEEAKTLAEKNFGKWTGGAAPEIKFPKQKVWEKGKVYLIDNPGAAQTVIYHFFPAPSRISDDYYPVSMANDVYGGGFGNRLNLNIREDKGYSYGVSAFTAAFKNAGVWIASGTVQTDKTKESIIEFVRELKNLAGEKPISEAEFEKSKLTKSRGYAQELEYYGSFIAKVMDLWYADLPVSSLQTDLDKLSKTNLNTVNSIAAKYADPTKANFVIAGDLSKIEAGIRELNLGEVVILDKNGNMVKK